MKQELMLLEKTLPLTAKEIQIPSKELNSIQKSQYLKNIEGTRNEIIKKIDVCMDFQKEQFRDSEKQKLIASLNKNGLSKLIETFNRVAEERNKLLQNKIQPLNKELSSLIKEFDKIVGKDSNLDLPVKEGGIENCDTIKIESFISDYHFKSSCDQEFEKKLQHKFETKKKVLQSKYKLLQDAILYYNVKRFKERLIDFLKERNEINKIYLQVIQNKPQIAEVSE